MADKMYPIRFFYKDNNNKLYYLDDKTDTLGCYESPLSKDLKYAHFELFKGYEANEEGLRKYKLDFHRDYEQLKKYGIDYRNFYKRDHHSAVESTFNRYSKKIVEKLRIQEATYTEYVYNNKCNNGGIIYFNHKYKDEQVETYGYDEPSFYPNILNRDDFYFPLEQGKEIKLTELDYDNLQYGIYKVKITSNNPEIRKVFCFKKDNHYTHISIAFAYKYKDKFDIHIELITDCEYNALVYDPNKLVSCKSIFGNWFNNLYNIKQKCKGNKLIKHLLTSLWGSLCKARIHYFTEEQYFNLESVSRDGTSEFTLVKEKYFMKDGEKQTTFECVRTEEPFKFPFGRLKAFLLDYSRNVMGEIIMTNNLLDKVIRVHTDNITLEDEFEFTGDFIPIPEDKTTGFIYWHNANDYHKVHYCYQYE
jgi:hypothetical protein